MPIITSPLFVYFQLYLMFSFNSSRISQSIIDIFGNISNIDNNELFQYYNNKKETTLNFITNMFIKFFNNEFFFLDYIFHKFFEEVTSSEAMLLLDTENNKTYYEFAKETCGHYSSINYANSQFSLLMFAEEQFIYCEATIIDNYLYYMNNKISDFLNVSFIPLYAENDTIITPDLCVLFLIRQLNYEIDENKINELYKKIIKGKSTIKDCFIN